jgi:integrase/recombinase XerD
MSSYARHAADYLRLRHALGHKLVFDTRILPGFAAYLESIAAPAITIEAALDWARLPGAGTGTWSRRLAVARGFARHMSGIDPATEVPPPGLIGFRRRWQPPFIYSGADVQALMAEVPRVIPTPLRAVTFQTMIGLLAATGMRIGEVIALGRGDIDWPEGVIVVKDAKFGKSREVPLDPTVTAALARYASLRDKALPAPASPAFFLSGRGTAVACCDFESRFRLLLARTGVGSAAPARPRVHDLRH